MSKFQKLRLTNLVLHSLYLIFATTLILVSAFGGGSSRFTQPQSVISFTAMNFGFYLLEIPFSIYEFSHNRLCDDSSKKIYHAATRKISFALYLTPLVIVIMCVDYDRFPFGFALGVAIPAVYLIIYCLDLATDFTARVLGSNPFSRQKP